MPFDDGKFNATATNGDLGGVAVKVTLALYAVARALEALHAGGDPASKIKEIRDAADDLSAMFDTLTGYVPK